MIEKQQWFLIETENEYQQALAQYEQVKRAEKDTTEYQEKQLLVHLISEYEKANNTLPEVDPVELIKIRMKDFGYKPTDLATLYGDKGTVSKVLNYKQALSITMIQQPAPHPRRFPDQRI